MRAALAGLSGLRQERFRVACDDPGTSGTPINCYKTCMRCLFGYLVSWGFLAVAASYIMEGPICKVILL